MEFGELIKAMTANQAKYLVRYISGNLKIGANEKTFVEALGDAFCAHFKKDDFEVWESAIRKALHAHPDFRKIIRTL